LHRTGAQLKIKDYKQLKNMKKITLTTLLLLLVSVMVFAQNHGILKTEITKEYTRYFFKYKKSLPILFNNQNGIIKYYLEGYKKIDGTNSYNLILQMDEGISNAKNKDIYVTIVFENYTVINSRPTIENKDFFNGVVTVPIQNMEQLSTCLIKSIIIKHNINDEVDIVFSNPEYGIQTIMIDSIILKNTIYQ
jgi:uncharacterized protein with PQ loop repeat